MDRTGRVVIPPSFADERNFFHGLAAVESQDRKWGFVDENGKIVISARFDDVRDFLEDLAPVQVGRKWGYIDISGRMVVEPQFQSAGEFQGGLARVYLWSKVVCTSGEFTSENAPLWAFHLIEDDNSDLMGCFPQNGRFGYIDEAGKFIVAPQFSLARDFSEGLAAVRVKETADSKYGYIDRTGRMVIAPRFDEAGPFSEGLAAIDLGARVDSKQVVNSAWGFIDHEGVLKIAEKYSFAGRFSEGLARVATQPGVHLGYIDHNGTMIISPKFSYASDFSGGLAATCAEKCGYIDRTGATFLSAVSFCWPFSDGLAVVGSRAPQDYIDRTGRVIALYARDK